MFEILTKTVDDNGDKGIDLSRKGMNDMIQKQYDLSRDHNARPENSGVNMVSLPVVLKKKVSRQNHKSGKNN